MLRPRDLLDHWFETLSFKDWFGGSEGLDEELRRRFGMAIAPLSADLPEEWVATPDNRLAAILLFDQIPRNIHRGTPAAFATDPLALSLAREAVTRGEDHAVDPARRAFFYLPFEHSENLDDQNTSVALFAALGDPVFLDYAERHRVVIQRFGRFPHRNGILGRVSTPEEEAYLAEPGAGF